MEPLIIKPIPPYDFDLSLAFLSRDDKHPAPDLKNGNNLLRIFRVNDREIPVKISSAGDVERPVLKIFTTELSSEERTELKEKTEEYLNLNDDLTGLYAFMEKDERLMEIKRHLYGFRVPMIGTTMFEEIIKAIIQQQISGRIAFYIASRVIKELGKCITFKDEQYYDFPHPNIFANISINKLSAYGISQRRAEYIINFSKEVVNNNFNPEEIRKWDYENIIKTLTRFKGIGKWTAEYIAATLGKGCGPADDLGLKRSISDLLSPNTNQSNTQKSCDIREVITKFPKGLAVYIVYAGRKGILKRLKTIE